MLTTVEGIYKNGSVELAEKPEGVREARVLVTFLSPETSPAAKSFQTLYGAWRGKFPEDFDVDATLKEIRGEWLKEWEENKNE
jgi:hypothetical protein